MLDYNLEKRRYVIGGVAIAIVVIYMIRLFTLQIMSDDYKKNADSNAFLKRIEFPARGAIYDVFHNNMRCLSSSSILNNW